MTATPCKSSTICCCPPSIRDSSSADSSATRSPEIRSPPVITSTAPWHFCSNILASIRSRMLDVSSHRLTPDPRHLTPLLPQRQDHVERAPLVVFAFHGDLPAVKPHDFLRQCQAQTGAGLFLNARIGAPIK